MEFLTAADPFCLATSSILHQREIEREREDSNTSALYKKILAANYSPPSFISESVKARKLQLQRRDELTCALYNLFDLVFDLVSGVHVSWCIRFAF